MAEDNNSNNNNGSGEKSSSTYDSHAGFISQFGASMKKNIQQKKNKPCGCVLETLLPVIFVIGLILIWLATERKTVQEKHFTNYTTMAATFNNHDIMGSMRLGACTKGYEGHAKAAPSPHLLPCPQAKANLEAFIKNMSNTSSRHMTTLQRGDGGSGSGGLEDILFEEEKCMTIKNDGFIIDWLCFLADPRVVATSFFNDFESPRVIPSLDELILAKWAVKAAFPGSANSRDSARSPLNAARTGGYLYFAPDTPEVKAFVDHLNKTSIYFAHVFGGIFSESDLETHVIDSSDDTGNEGQNWAAVVIKEMTATKLDYKIRANRTLIITEDAFDTFYSGGINDRTKLYFLVGFMTLQREVSNYYMANIKGMPLPPEPVQSIAGFVKYEEQIFLQIAGGLAPLMLVLSFLYPVSQLVKAIVLEKESGVREAMMIMSLGTGSFYMSWFVTYALQFLITSILCTILLSATFVPQSNPVIIFFAFYLFSVSNIALSAMMSSLFSKARLASLMSPVIFFLLAMPMYATDNVPKGVHWLLTLLSPSAFSTALQLLFNYEMGPGMGNEQLAAPNDPVPMIGALFMLGLDTILYILLTLYFDAVFPSDWGTKRHPLFCFVEPFRWLTSKNKTEEIPEDSRDPNGVFEDDSNSTNPVSVRILGLRKQFSRGTDTFTAVNDMHLNLRENEVNVLLGHNGAGKSTTMNMMTGMIEIDKGDCTVYGKSVKTETAAVHKMIGYCPQRNILWPELTCYQHLDFFATIKGVPADQRDAEVRKMLVAVDLGDKIDYASGALSGGQKRKLSVAIAFIGNSKLVFLDEPTAGMDVAARRHTWDVIKEMTPGRTILLTTHFMDEADLLGHTISIMSKGMLKCSGSSVFLKSRLGVGYSLNMSVDPTIDHNDLMNTIVQHVDDAQQLPCGAGELAFRLPVGATAAFPKLLETLETTGPEMGCKNFGVTVTTLEEVFLKIADEDETPADSKSPPRSSTPQAGSPNSQTPPQLKSPGGSHVEVDPRHEELWEIQSSQADRSISGVTLYKRQFIANLMKRFHNSKRDRRTQMLQVVVPVICVLLSMLFTLLVFTSTSPMDIHPDMYTKYGINEQNFDTANCDGLLDPSNWNERLEHHSLNFTTGEEMSRNLVDTFKKQGKQRFHAMTCMDPKLSAIIGRNASILHHNTTGFHSIADVTNQYYRNYIKTHGADGANIDVLLTAHPFPLTDRESALFSSIRTILISIIILIPFTFIPSTFVSWIVKEYETHAKHLQTSSGLNFYVYWMSNLLFDFVSFLVTAILVIIVFLIFNRTEYIGNGENFGAIFLLFIFYGLAGIAGSYLVSFAFSEHAQAQNIVMLSNFIAGFLLVLVIFILGSIESTESAAKVLKYFFRFIPSYCLGEGIINMATADLVAAFGVHQNRFDMDVTGWPMLYMALEFPIFMIATFLIDHPARRMKQQRLLHNPNAKPDEVDDEDPDVLAERELIENDDPSRSDDLVTVKYLSKVYPGGKKAVKNISYGVKKGEVFGFLGTNGAGKTTTISILCGEHMPTTGHCKVVGFDVVEDALQAQRNIGYCPQFDATLDLLTVQEHLELYSAIRGLDSHAISVVVPGLMEVCGLATYKDVIAVSLSGGNRRKLSVAISLIGGPRVVFLDEPSAGMDPMARRGMWEVIDHISTQCAVVLTTHHLEEVEALAHRVAIMVDGTLRCIGDKTHLKTKFGSGFEMVVRLSSERNAASFEHFVLNSMPDASLNEKRGTKYTYALPPSTKLSEAFQQIEEVKSETGIEDYCISQTSLEQVFLRISESALEAADANLVSPANASPKTE